jgi:hypothetical protein
MSCAVATRLPARIMRSKVCSRTLKLRLSVKQTRLILLAAKLASLQTSACLRNVAPSVQQISAGLPNSQETLEGYQLRLREPSRDRCSGLVVGTGTNVASFSAMSAPAPCALYALKQSRSLCKLSHELGFHPVEARTPGVLDM